MNGQTIDDDDHIVRIGDSEWHLTDGASDGNFSTCVSEISTNGGGILYLPFSTITLSDTYTINANTTIIGCGGTLKMDGDHTLLTLNANSSIVNVVLEMNNNTSSSRSIINIGGDYVTIDRCTIYNNITTYSIGVYSYMHNYLKVVNCTFYSLYMGVYIRGQHYSSFEGNSFTSATYGFYVNYGSSSTDHSTYIIISGNVIYGGSYSLRVRYSDYISIVGNNVSALMYMDAGLTHTGVVGNQWSGSTGSGSYTNSGNY